MNSLIATVAVDNTFFSYDTDYSYIVPNSLSKDVQIGSKVSVPFGRGDKTRDGIIVNLIEELTVNIDGLKEIKSVEKKVLSDEMVKLATNAYTKIKAMLTRHIMRPAQSALKKGPRLCGGAPVCVLCPNFSRRYFPRYCPKNVLSLSNGISPTRS